jgi:hypothetical protein
MKRRKRRKEKDSATRQALDRLRQRSRDPAATDDEATGDKAADKVNPLWRQNFKEHPEGALNDLRARVKECGYELAYAGRTFAAPITQRTYYIVDADDREPIHPFGNGKADLTLFDVCVWCEQATAQSP